MGKFLQFSDRLDRFSFHFYHISLHNEGHDGESMVPFCEVNRSFAAKRQPVHTWGSLLPNVTQEMNAMPAKNTMCVARVLNVSKKVGNCKLQDNTSQRMLRVLREHGSVCDGRTRKHAILQEGEGVSGVGT